MGLSEGAKKYWLLKYSNLSTGPIIFKTDNALKLLVKAKHINYLKELQIGIKEDEMSKSFLVIGGRGYGKTTSIRYLDYLIRTKSKNIASIICDCPGDPSSGNDLRLILHKNILSALIEFVGRNEKMGDYAFIQQKEIQKQIEYVNSNDLFLIENSIITLLEKISKAYDRIIFSIDNLDKIHIKKWQYINDYFNHNQGFIEKIQSSGRFKCVYLIISLHTFVADSLTKQVSYLSQEIIRIPDWEYKEIDELIKKRLRICSSLEKFQSTFYIKNDLIKLIWMKNRGNPRFSLTATANILERGYEVAKMTNKKIRGLDYIFGKKYLNEIIGNRTLVEFTKFRELNEEIDKRYPKTNKIIEKSLITNSENIHDLIELIMNLTKSKTLNIDSLEEEEKILSNILINEGLVLKTQRKKKVIIKLTTKIYSMMNLILYKLNNDEESVLFYLVTKYM